MFDFNHLLCVRFKPGLTEDQFNTIISEVEPYDAGSTDGGGSHHHEYWCRLLVPEDWCDWDNRDELVKSILEFNCIDTDLVDINRCTIDG